MIQVAFERMYVDLPPDTKAKLKVLAAERGTSMKALVAKLIEDECKRPKKPATKKRKKTTRRK